MCVPIGGTCDRSVKTSDESNTGCAPIRVKGDRNDHASLRQQISIDRHGNAPSRKALGSNPLSDASHLRNPRAIWPNLYSVYWLTVNK